MAEGALTPRVRLPLDASVVRSLTTAGFTVASARPTRVQVDLWDTGDRRLAAAGAEMSCNARDGWRWRRDGLGHPKLPSVEWRAPADSPRDIVLGWSRAYRRGRPLEARATVTVHRREHTVSAGDGAAGSFVVVEERIDERRGKQWVARIRRAGVVAAGGRTAPSPSALFADLAIDDESTLVILRPSSVRAPRLRLPGADLVGPRDLFVRSITLSLVQWLYYDSELADGGSVDAIHKLRVALRRMRSDLQTFAPVLDRAWGRRLRDLLGELAARFGVVRDAEVLAARLSEVAATFEGPDREAANAVARVAETQLAELRAHLLDELGGSKYPRVADELVMALTRPAWADTSADDLDDGSPSRLARRPLSRLRRHVAALARDPVPDELHRARILAKRARYAAEACIPVAGDAAATAAARLADLQGVLGEQHDAVVTGDWLRQTAAAEPALAYGAGLLAAVELERQRDRTASWRAAWQVASRRRLWRWLRS